MLKTKPELYRVIEGNENHLWLEVLEGEDSGIRVSVPVFSKSYSGITQKKVAQFDPGEVYELILVSEREDRPMWRVKSVVAKRGSLK